MSTPSYVEDLKEFIEGRRCLQEWPAWWRENTSIIEQNEGRIRYLKIKLNWREDALAILKHYNISFTEDTALNWARCRFCGEPVFHAIPHVTTQEQVRAFARASNLPDKEIIERMGWIHPGALCPNGCTRLFVTYDDLHTPPGSCALRALRPRRCAR